MTTTLVPKAAWQPTLKTVGRRVGTCLAFVIAAVMLRRAYVSTVAYLNPDEAELIAQGRAALRSLIPFTTWTTTTAGPVWVLFLALVGAVGVPLTIPAAHLLAAALFGLLGYLGFALAHRVLTTTASLVLTLFWWLPIVLMLDGIAPTTAVATSLPANFAALTTELLPCAFVLSAMLIRTEALARQPRLYALSGLLVGLAFGSKYQVLPLAIAVLVVQFLLVGELTRRAAGRAALFAGIGAVGPYVVLGLATVLSPDVRFVAIKQHLHFLASYGDQLPFGARMAGSGWLLLDNHTVLLTLLVLWLGVLSTPRVRALRALFVFAGVAAIFMGGLFWGHYLILLYASFALAIALPLKPGAELIPVVEGLAARLMTGTVIVVAAWLLAFGTNIHFPRLTDFRTVGEALSADAGDRDPRLAAVCPPGSTVLIWGFAAQMYVNYSWTNAIPFLNTAQLTRPPKNYWTGYDLVRDAIADPSTTCVVDAVGPPFVAAGDSLTTFYPQLAGPLEQQYQRVDGVVDCGACAIYVRR